MFLFSNPSDAQIRRFLSRAAESTLSYSAVGATSAPDIPSSYVVDHNRVHLGDGLQAWNRAVEAIRQWKMFEMNWLQLCWPSTPIVVGQNVAVLARFPNCYWLNAARIVYVIDEDGPTRRFGFAYGKSAEEVRRRLDSSDG